MKSALHAVRDRDVESYTKAIGDLIAVRQLKIDEAKCTVLLNKLRDLSPQLCRRLLEEFAEPTWDMRCQQFEQAWNWARCSAWLAAMSDPAAMDNLSADVEVERRRIRDRIRRIAAGKAWAHCLAPQRLQEEQRQHLRAWAAAVRRVGRGTGRHANRHREAARKHMEECRPAIPAWIMPIFRVAETIPPLPEAFDVVIIDEASQSGPEALFLMYLGKQVVVVGDDKQISPDFIGLNHDDVNLLRDRRISDVPHADALAGC